MGWMKNVYKKLETVCLELDDILEQERLEYVNQLQTVGANVKQFCSDVVRDVLPQPADDAVDVVTSKSGRLKNTEAEKMSKEGIVRDHFVKNTGADKMSKEGIVRDHFVKNIGADKMSKEGIVRGLFEPCNVSHLLSVKPVEATKYDLSLEKMIGAAPSSKSVNLVFSYESKVPELGFTSSDASAESIRQLDNSAEYAANLGSSCTGKLDGSCFIIDCNELSSVSYEAGQLGSPKETLENVSLSTMRAGNQGYNQGPAFDPKSSQQKEGFASSVITTPDHELCDSDWVIV